MYKSGFFIALLLILISHPICSEEPASVQIPGKLNVGLGMGQTFGGLIGSNLTYQPNSSLGIFAGGGLTYAGLGYNIGAKVMAKSQNKASLITPFATGMYGYNAMLSIENSANLNKLFYGATLGVGLDFKTRNNGSHWSFALLVPIRNNDRIDEYIQENRITISHRLPISLSFGYYFATN